jgi:multiple sugar transport system substrate-binding protein
MKASKTSITLLAVLVTLLLSATFVQAQDKTELQIAWWGSQNRHDRTIQVINMYMEQHPEVNIVYEFATFADYWPLMNTKAAGGQLPCIMQQDYAYLTEWASRGLLVPLDPYYASGAIDTTNIAQSLLDGGKVGDEIYAISLGTNSQSVILDVDAFAQAGIDLPAPDWTWQDFEDIVTQLHEKLGVWGIALGQAGVGNNNGIEDVQVWKAYNLGYGYPVASADGTELGYSDDQPTIDYFSMIRRLQDSGSIATGEEAAEFNNVPLESSPIVTGDSVMQYQWSNQVVAVYSGAGPERHFKLWPLPRPEGGQSSNYLKPSQFFSITSTCQTPDLAADFINFFTNDLTANEALFAERGVPISSVVREHLLPMLDAAGTETFDFIERITADSSPIPLPDPPKWSDFTTNIYQAQVANPVIYGQMTPEDAAAALRAGAADVLGS